MTHLPTAGTAQGFHFTSGIWREIVVQDKIIIVWIQSRIDQGLIVFGAQGQRRERLRFTAGKNGRTVGRGQVVHFAPDGSNVCGHTAIEAHIVGEHHVADDVFLALIEIPLNGFGPLLHGFFSKFFGNFSHTGRLDLVCPRFPGRFVRSAAGKGVEAFTNQFFYAVFQGFIFGNDGQFAFDQSGVSDQLSQAFLRVNLHFDGLVG